jgi:predicted ATPase/DNA-binding CsgD family transcriptional regulator
MADRRADPDEWAGNLPADSPGFIGRRGLLADAVTLLATSVVVTLSGPGGAGKSRLADQVARRVRRSFPDGVWLVDVSAATGPALVAHTVAAALRVSDQSSRPPADLVVDRVRGRRMLLILDNCEHLVHAVRDLVDAVTAVAPSTRVLATSRIALDAVGEHNLPVPPLTMPDPERGERFSARAVTQFEALALLEARGRARTPEFAITANNWQAAVRLVRALDGIPLAIELAAARLRSLSVRDILDRLADRFDLLTTTEPDAPAGRRNHTLRAVVDWSYDLCTPAEQLLWARLSVFPGQFDLTAIEEICADEHLARSEILDLVDSLVRQSMLTADTAGSVVRYRLLETMRQYAHDRLSEQGGVDAVRRRHARHFHTLAEQAATASYGPEQLAWLGRLTQDLPNLRAALDFLLTEPDAQRGALALATALAHARFWYARAAITEGRLWLDRALQANPAPTALRGTALALAALLALVQGEHDAADHLLAAGHTAVRDSAGRDSDARATARARATLIHVAGTALWLRGDPRSVAMLAEARDRFAALDLAGDRFQASLRHAIASATVGSDRQDLRAIADAVMAEAQTVGASWAMLRASFVDGLVELRRGNAGGAATRFRAALLRQREIGDSWGPLWTVLALAETHRVLAHRAASTGTDTGTDTDTDTDTDTENITLAAVLLGAQSRLREQTGMVLVPSEPFAAWFRDTKRAARAALGEQDYTAAFRHGHALRHDDLLGMLAGDQRPHSEPVDALGLLTQSGLTAREQEVALLAAEGLTNPQIATRLLIGRRTVATHVSHALTKLHLRSRVQIPGWIAAHAE